MEPRSTRDIEILQSPAEVYCFRLNFNISKLVYCVGKTKVQLRGETVSAVHEDVKPIGIGE